MGGTNTGVKKQKKVELRCAACGKIEMISKTAADRKEQRSSASNVWLACCCSPRPIIGMNEHWTTLTRRRLLVVHGWPSGARVSRHPTACSHHSYGVDSTTRQFCANCIMKVFFNDCQASNQWRSGDRGDRDAVRDGEKSGKCPAPVCTVFCIALA